MICPVGWDVMVDPYIHNCGNSFDYVNIRTLMVCPLCRGNINIGINMFPNRGLKNLIETSHFIETANTIYKRKNKILIICVNIMLFIIIIVSTLSTYLYKVHRRKI
jgi:hypothetical protein